MFVWCHLGLLFFVEIDEKGAVSDLLFSNLSIKGLYVFFLFTIKSDKGAVSAVVVFLL